MGRLIVAALVLLAALAPAAAAEEAGIDAFYPLGPVVLHGDEADALTLGLGAYDFADTATSPAGTVEYRFGRKLFFIGPSYGLLANTDKALMGYVGAYLDASYGNLYLTPQLAIGGYKEGDSRNLGGIFQFRASGDLTWRFENGLRVGLRLAHVSNANTSDPNPGEEELYLICSLRLGPYL